MSAARVKPQRLGADVEYRVCAAPRRIWEAALCRKPGLCRIHPFSHSFRNCLHCQFGQISPPQDEEKSSRKQKQNVPSTPGSFVPQGVGLAVMSPVGSAGAGSAPGQPGSAGGCEIPGSAQPQLSAQTEQTL